MQSNRKQAELFARGTTPSEARPVTTTGRVGEYERQARKIERLETKIEKLENEIDRLKQNHVRRNLAKYHRGELEGYETGALDPARP